MAGDRAPEAQRARATGHVADADVNAGSDRPGREARGVEGEPRWHAGLKGGERRCPRGGAGVDVQGDLVVVQGESADRGAVAPEQVVGRPVLRIWLPGEDGVVTDHVAGDAANTGGNDAVSHGFKRAQGRWSRNVRDGRWRVYGGAMVQLRWLVGNVVGGEVSVAGADEGEITGERAGVDRPARLDAGGHGCPRTEQRHGGGGGEELGVAGGVEELLGVNGNQGVTVECGDRDAPMRAGNGGVGEQAIDLPGKCTVRCRSCIRRLQWRLRWVRQRAGRRGRRHAGQKHGSQQRAGAESLATRGGQARARVRPVSLPSIAIQHGRSLAFGAA